MCLHSLHSPMSVKIYSVSKRDSNCMEKSQVSSSGLDHGALAPWHYQVLKLLFISVLYWFHGATSWTKMAATAPAITSAIQPARRKTFPLRTLPGQYTHHFYSYPIGQNWVTWPRPDARETWVPVICLLTNQSHWGRWVMVLGTSSGFYHRALQ